jgi:hypothetical protein
MTVEPVATIAKPPERGPGPDWAEIATAVSAVIVCLLALGGLIWWLAVSYAQMGALRSDFEALRNDITTSKSELNRRFDDHEARIRALEKRP